MQFTEPNLFTALAEGNLTFAYGISPFLFLLLVVLIVAAVWLSYWKTTRPLTPAWKAFFVGGALKRARTNSILFAAASNNDHAGIATGNLSRRYLR